MIQSLRKWLLRRELAVCSHRREELQAIVTRELNAIEADEHNIRCRLEGLEEQRMRQMLSARGL